MYKILISILFIFLLASKSNSEVIKKVNIINNDRITKETILVFSDIKIGKDYTSNDLNQIIKDLFSTNFFFRYILKSRRRYLNN